MVTLWASALAEEAAQVTEEVTEAVAETAAKADPTWAQEAVEKFAETPGTVWIAVADATHTEAQLLSFPGRRRQQNIDRTVNQAFSMLIHTICQKH